MKYIMYKSPLGTITICAEDGAITALRFEEPSGGEPGNEYPLDEAVRQLREYFEGSRREFDLPMRLDGTPFQKKVWSALQGIPYGETRSYAEIARAIENPRACRAVGGANNKNAISIVIPCHRVIGAGGSLVGYGGGLEKKAALLELEKKDAGKEV